MKRAAVLLCCAAAALTAQKFVLAPNNVNAWRLSWLRNRESLAGYGLTAVWDMCGGSGQTVADLSGNGYALQLGSSGSPDANDPARGASGLVFNGSSSFCTRSLTGMPSPTAAFSVCTVFRNDTPATGLTSIKQRIASWNNGVTSADFALGPSTATGGNRSIWLSVHDASAATLPNAASDAVPTGWNTACGTFDGASRYRVYLNGSRSSIATTVTSTGVTTPIGLWLGVRASGSNGYWNGYQSLVALWGREISAQEAAAFHSHAKRILAQDGVLLADARPLYPRWFDSPLTQVMAMLTGPLQGGW